MCLTNTHTQHTHIYTHTLSHSPSLKEDEVFLQALEEVENVLEADREMEIGAQKEARIKTSTSYRIPTPLCLARETSTLFF